MEFIITTTIVFIQSIIVFFVLRKYNPNYDKLIEIYRCFALFFLTGLFILLFSSIFGTYSILTGLIGYLLCIEFQQQATKKDEGYIE